MTGASTESFRIFLKDNFFYTFCSERKDRPYFKTYEQCQLERHIFFLRNLYSTPAEYTSYATCTCMWTPVLGKKRKKKNIFQNGALIHKPRVSISLIVSTHYIQHCVFTHAGFRRILNICMSVCILPPFRNRYIYLKKKGHVHREQSCTSA